MFTINNEMLLLLLPDFIPKDGGIAEDHGAAEAWKLPRAKTRGCREKKITRVRAAHSPQLNSAESDKRGK